MAISTRVPLDIFAGEAAKLFGPELMQRNFEWEKGLVMQLPIRYAYPAENGVHVTEVAYNDTHQIVWHWSCHNTIVENDATFFSLNVVGQSQMYTALDNQFGELWRSLMVKTTSEWADGVAAAFPQATGEVLLEETPINYRGNIILMKVGYLRLPN